MLNRIFKKINLDRKTFMDIIIGSAIMAFTLVNIHAQSKITEGGVLGLNLFMKNVLGTDPAITSPILDISLFLFGYSIFGKKFLAKTILSALIFAGIYKIFLLIGPVVPSLYDAPILAAVVGGIGIGIGCGMIVSNGIASGGDDSLAMIVAKKTGMEISWSYLSMDIVVLALSLIYIPLNRIFFSLITTIVSSFILDQFHVDLNTSKEIAKKALPKQKDVFLEAGIK